jgi:hypothetical protein
MVSTGISNIEGGGARFGPRPVGFFVLFRPEAATFVTSREHRHGCEEPWNHFHGRKAGERGSKGTDSLDDFVTLPLPFERGTSGMIGSTMVSEWRQRLELYDLGTNERR